VQDREPTFGDGRYLIRRELGRGTMGVVYEAEDAVLARTVALKTIEVSFAPGEVAGTEFERRFFTEARVAARLSHPGIVVCHDVGKDPATGKLFIVFEYLKGRTLADRVEEGPFPWREAASVVVRVARAIHHAHEHGVVHRDLKPANIMLLDPGTSGASAAPAETAVKIMDFGVARLESLGQRLTRTGQSFGSPLYTSPEQALGHASSARSDIFSLGSVLCTLLLGRPWFDAPSLPAIVARVVHDDAPRLAGLRSDVPASLDVVLAVALAKREEDRYATAALMAEDLEDVLAGKPPRHAATMAPRPPARRSADDALLAGLSVPGAGRRGLPSQDPLASLLDEPAMHEAARTVPLPAGLESPKPEPAPAGPAVAVERRSRHPGWMIPAIGTLLIAILAIAALVPWHPSPELDRAPSPPIVSEAPPTTVASVEAPVASAPAPSPTSTSTALESSPPPVPAVPATTVPPEVPSPAPTVRPTPQASARPVVEPPPTPPPATAPRPEEASPGEPAQTRIRLAVEHPFENGRLVAWIDGVLVYETKLQATASKRIVAFKVREGRVETLLDVEPGPHEVRVEVTWEQDRRTGKKVVDVAPNATGLLEVRVGRMSKDLSLTWSRLAKD
jgi:serine/threonine-protein kinase